ncbi:MAG: hypothetical protein L0226_06395 [Acidobacteria bacterium]|nr:hypothetical protein [Acidobacteriota bacterium]
MNIRKSLTKSLICLLVVFIIGVVAFADTIRLKDGSVLKGKVVSYAQGKFTIVVYIGGTTSKHIIPAEEVESVEFDSSDVVASTRDTSTSGTLVPVNPEVQRSERSPSIPSKDPSLSSRPGKETANPAAATDVATAEADAGTASVLSEKTVNVAAAADWTSTEIRVQRGQRIVISASGEVELGNNRRSGPDGLSLTDSRKLMASRPTGALIAVVGDDNDNFVFIGGAGEFVSTHNGILFLSVNEGNLKDNNGSFVARVKVMSGK